MIEVLESVDLAGIAAAVTALSITIVGIAFALQGATVGKRVVRRV
ncbi:hypothetical protein SAMN02745117_01639 [Lampropedia hyalina DSM 16112]|jgi:hypothetical protein|uniref:Uncharacterized protein n=1 Tax=Lampropedia hyalina DSM 16112 TaxID=1122156 RepID=A0A1M5ABW2_9BURK|nr:hypothetical protein [Lampropedia hyalina]SHF27811.1 hypothetical protein SAMN02745117_01639 [Lampropedia hyalina DSM 16112]